MKKFQSNILNIKTIACLCGLAMANVSYAQQATTPPPKPVSVDEVRYAPLESLIQLHGTVFGRDDVKLTAGANGQLTYVAEPGQALQKGDVVAQIDMLPLELEKAEQKALIKRSKIQLALQKKILARLQKLAKTDNAAASQIDEVQAEYDIALTDIELTEIRLQQINDRIKRATVRAPFNGLISQRYRQAGSDVNRAEELLMMLDTEHLEVRLFVPIKYLNTVRTHTLLNISPDSDTNMFQTTARVSAIIPATDPRSQTFELRAQISSNDTQAWATGQLVQVQVPVGKTAPSLLINRDALILRSDDHFVVKIDSDNKAHRVPVRVGMGQGDWVQVNLENPQDLAEGDVLAIRGAERLQEGDEVSIQTKNKV